MRFTKMHGLGNDYIYLNCMEAIPDDLPALAVRLSNRNFGVGGDGLICLCPSDIADLRMDMYNADGSRGAMCGNGIRCVGKLAYDTGIARKETMSVETRAGVKILTLQVEGGAVQSVTVDMGPPEPAEPCTIAVGDKEYTITPVSMGNPHAVLFTAGIDHLDLEKIGPGFEHHPMFPDRVNTEFVEVIDRRTLRMRVWERGSGETLACGTGACAVLVAAVQSGLADRDATVRLRGGDLAIRWAEDGHVYMTGPAVTVFEGELV